MSTLAEMTMSEAVAKAFEVMFYGSYQEDVKGNSWRGPYTGSFEQWLKDNEYDAEYGDPEPWSEFKSESVSGEMDEWSAKVEASYGGEGQGDAYWMVISVSDGVSTRYFRKDGWYASYSGGELDGDAYEVFPKVRQVTFYETAQEANKPDKEDLNEADI